MSAGGEVFGDTAPVSLASGVELGERLSLSLPVGRDDFLLLLADGDEVVESTDLDGVCFDPLRVGVGAALGLPASPDFAFCCSSARPFFLSFEPVESVGEVAGAAPFGEAVADGWSPTAGAHSPCG